MKINPMKNLMTFGLALASLTLAATSCSENKTTTETTTTAPATEATMSADSTSSNGMAATYTCPMHPEVVSNQPGQCPKCHMDLVKK